MFIACTILQYKWLYLQLATADEGDGIGSGSGRHESVASEKDDFFCFTSGTVRGPSARDNSQYHRRSVPQVLGCFACTHGMSGVRIRVGASWRV